LQVRNDGSMIFGTDVGGVIGAIFNFKGSGNTSLMKIEDQSGTDFYHWKNGQYDISSQNSVAGGSTTEMRMMTVSNQWRTTLRASYNGAYYMETAYGGTGYNRFYHSGTHINGGKSGVTHLSMAGTRHVKIGGTAGIYATSLTFDVRDTSNVSFLNITTATGNVAINVPTATEKLHVVGSIRMVDGNEGAGKVLTDVAGDGVGVWTTVGADLNGIYTGSGSLSGATTVTMGANALTFIGTNTTTFDGSTATGFITEVKRDFDAGVGGRGTSQTINSYGSEVRTVRTNGTALSIFNEWTIGASRKSFDFVASINGNYFSVYDASNGTTETTRIGDETSWWKPSVGSYGFGFGHDSPLAGTVHVDNMDFRVEGLTDPQLFLVDYSTDNVGIGIASPTSKLHVDGGVAISGNVTTPNQKLQVSGNTTSTSYSSFIGVVGAGTGTTTGIYTSTTPLAGTSTHRGIFVDAISSNSTVNHGIHGVARNGSSQNIGVYGQIVSETVVASFGSFAVYGNNQGGAGNLHVGVKARSISAGTNSYGLYSEASGSATNNIGGYFTVSNGTNNYAIITTGGNSGFGVPAPASMVTVDDAVEVTGADAKIILEDRTLSTRYEVYMDNGTLVSNAL